MARRIPQGSEVDQPDSTGTEDVRMSDAHKHTTHAVVPLQLHNWLGRVQLDLVSYHTRIDRYTLKGVRDGKPAREKCWLH